MRLLTLVLILHSSLTAARKLQTIEFSEKTELTCGQGLTDCKINRGNDCVCHDDSVLVRGLAAEAVLCHSHPCLKIHINFTFEGSQVGSGLSSEAINEDERGEMKEEEHGSSLGLLSPAAASASLEVCYISPEFSGSKNITFTLDLSADQATQMWVSLVVKLTAVRFGSVFTVFTANQSFRKDITLPSIDTVCSQGLDVPLCNVPILRRETNHTSGMVKLHVDTAGRDSLNELLACQTMEKDGECLQIEWKDNPLIIPMSSVAPCLCFQVWWKKGGLRNNYCPFLNDTVLSGANISVSVVEQRETQDEVYRHSTALVWNITAPCRLQAELQLCKRTSGSGCHEIHGKSKMRHHPKWKNHNRHWEFVGEFTEVERHPSVCVQINVKGLEGHFKPVCPFEVRRAHWSFVLLVCVVLLCLTILGVYAVQGALKGWVFRWLKVDEIRGAVGGSHVVLLYPPDAGSSLTELVCRLASSLSSLGFSVSLDLWSHSELSALGPVPWLHSRLDQVQRQGGKVVLVLTQAAWARSEEWGRHAGAKRMETQKEEEEEEDSDHSATVSPCSDVFSASLSCILADYLQGRAGERFVLIQFEAQPAGSPGAGELLPELFRGLSLFSLPSQSLGFLTELDGGTQKRQAGRAVDRRMRAGVLRARSRALAEALRELREGTGYKLVGLSQGFRMEDPWESIPLQQGQSSPSASPELHNKNNTPVNWV
uniref:SEFIR domain-containing protein n=1 Tax=Astyanax mexicanus TaxID=7994 RepID=A0A3B1IJI3_ASTMX